MSIFKLPDLGEGLPEAEIREWLVKEGDTVKEDQPMVSMETAKAVVDVPAPCDGVIKKLHGQPGDIIETGAPLVSFEGAVEVEENTEDAGTVVGNIQTSNTVLEEAATGIATRKTSTTRVRATPAVRKLAKSMGIDLNNVSGTGPHGSIIATDLQNAVGSESSDANFEKLHGARRSMAQIMAKSHAEVVPVTIVDDADIHNFTKGTDTSVRFVRAVVAACQAEPSLNAHFSGKHLERKQFNEINIAIAVDTPQGLYTPVIHDAANLNDEQIREKINEFKKLAVDSNFTPELLRGATITLSNFGIFIGRYASPIVVPPMVAIIATGKRRDEVVAVDGKPEIHKIVPISLTFDHRAVTGGESARFLKALVENLQS